MHEDTADTWIQQNEIHAQLTIFVQHGLKQEAE